MRPGHERTRGLGGGAGSWGVAQVVSEWPHSTRWLRWCVRLSELQRAALVRIARVLGVQQ
ncbi:MAG TPA: hypothetical protein PKJ45_00080 [Rubrivivax sp.]|nr:hypothetical protein [Rubrivivax sp.]